MPACIHYLCMHIRQNTTSKLHLTGMPLTICFVCSSTISRYPIQHILITFFYICICKQFTLYLIYMKMQLNSLCYVSEWTSHESPCTTSNKRNKCKTYKKNTYTHNIYIYIFTIHWTVCVDKVFVLTLCRVRILLLLFVSI